MAHAIAILTGILKGGKIETKDGKEYYKGLLCISTDIPGVIIEVYGKKIESIESLKGEFITVQGECRLEEKASTQKIDRDLVISVKSFSVTDRKWCESVFGEQYFVGEHCHLHIMGNNGRDPELKYFDSGKVKADFSLAVSYGKNSPTSWFECEAWEKTAEIVGNYVQIGNALSVVSASPKLEQWEPKDGGETRRKWKFIVKKIDLHSRKENEGVSSGIGGSSVGEKKSMWEKLKSMPTNSKIADKIDKIDDVPF
jgi:single-strand DNA-binding protein